MYVYTCILMQVRSNVHCNHTYCKEGGVTELSGAAPYHNTLRSYIIWSQKARLQVLRRQKSGCIVVVFVWYAYMCMCM